MTRMTPFSSPLMLGFDTMEKTLERIAKGSEGYPPYNIEALDENQYAITLAIAGFKQSELDIQTENGVLTIRGNKENESSKQNFLHKGIAQRSFERKFNLADHVEVVNANVADGLLHVELLREIPDAMKPKKISIKSATSNVIQQAHSEQENQAA